LQATDEEVEDAGGLGVDLAEEEQAVDEQHSSDEE
jgi:hypothetical protein